MRCPACGRTLQPRSVGDIAVDVCDGGCGGIWFDRFELAKVDQSREHAGEALLDVKRGEGVGIDPNKRRLCPRCGDRPMLQHFSSVKRDVVIDECPACAGFWIDFGELRTIREAFATEADRRQAAQAYFADVFDVELEALRAASELDLDRARRIALVFRYVAPSYYLPGKQKWGAW